MEQICHWNLCLNFERDQKLRFIKLIGNQFAFIKKMQTAKKIDVKLHAKACTHKTRLKSAGFKPSKLGLGLRLNPHGYQVVED